MQMDALPTRSTEEASLRTQVYGVPRGASTSPGPMSNTVAKQSISEVGLFCKVMCLKMFLVRRQNLLSSEWDRDAAGKPDFEDKSKIVMEGSSSKRKTFESFWGGKAAAACLCPCENASSIG